MENFPLISIGIPVIRSQYLEEALKCALDQTYKNFEIILLNNASNQTVKEEIKNISIKYSSNKIKYYENEIQIPIIQNWNKVLEYSKGDFFAILCDDDKWSPFFLEKLVSCIMKYPNSNIIHTRTAIINDDNQIVKYSQICAESESVFEFLYERVFYFRAHFLSDFLLKTSALKKIGGFVEIKTGWGSDDLTWVKVAGTSDIIYCKDILCYYRDSRINVSSVMGFKQKINSLDEYISKLRNFINQSKKDHEKFDIQLRELILNELNNFQKRYENMFLERYLLSKFFNKKKIARIIMVIFRKKYLQNARS